MSLHYTSYAPKQRTYQGDRFAKAEEIFQWLLAEDAIKPEKNEDGISSEDVYFFSEGILNFLDVPAERLFNTPSLWAGFSYTTKREVYCPIENWDKGPACPVCADDLNPCTAEGEGMNRLSEGIGKWMETGEELPVVCPACNSSSSLADYRFVPDWGFSDLGFKFYECTKLSGAFVEELECRLGCRVWIVPTWT